MPLIRETPADELSPYLVQHVDNPVDWYPWGDEAFERARHRDRPIFLSIGYSACHWCHVMAHESFEDPAIADLLNASFVSIKVDREERPDVDAVYMEAVQALTGSGGWPMSVFLMPDGRPFFGGTYFPPDDRRGTPSFPTVLRRPDRCLGQPSPRGGRAAAELVGVDRLPVVPSRNAAGTNRRSLAGPQPGVDPARLLDAGGRRAGPAVRSRHGAGSGPPPSSPSRRWSTWPCASRTRRPASETTAHALVMATTTLDAMAAGGIHDHLGGGFARYSTDDRVAGPPFREDALRPGRPAAGLPARLAGHRTRTSTCG